MGAPRFFRIQGTMEGRELVSCGCDLCYERPGRARVPTFGGSRPFSQRWGATTRWSGATRLYPNIPASARLYYKLGHHATKAAANG